MVSLSPEEFEESFPEGIELLLWSAPMPPPIRNSGPDGSGRR